MMATVREQTPERRHGLGSRCMMATVRESGHPRGMFLDHTYADVKPAGVGTNGILECKLMSKSGHRAHRKRTRALQARARIQL
jgi:hypothetical protein